MKFSENKPYDKKFGKYNVKRNKEKSKYSFGLVQAFEFFFDHVNMFFIIWHTEYAVQ